jgi:hypothetical protein
MKRLFACLLSFTVFFAFAVLLHAQPKGGKCPMGPHHFKMMDTDKDGKVSLAEWEEAHKNKFKEIDKNGDGFLTDDEMKKGPMGPPPKKK